MACVVSGHAALPPACLSLRRAGTVRTLRSSPLGGHRGPPIPVGLPKGAPMVLAWVARLSPFTRKSTLRRGRSRRRISAVPRVEALEERTVPSILIPVANHRDLVYDPVRNAVDITT